MPLENQRQAGEHRQHRPYQYHHEKAVPHLELAFFLTRGPPQGHTDRQRQQKRLVIGGIRAVIPPPGQDQRHQQGQRKADQQQTEDTNHRVVTFHG
jgi:hypothetical protein